MRPTADIRIQVTLGMGTVGRLATSQDSTHLTAAREQPIMIQEERSNVRTMLVLGGSLPGGLEIQFIASTPIPDT